MLFDTTELDGLDAADFDKLGGTDLGELDSDAVDFGELDAVPTLEITGSLKPRAFA